MLQAVALQIIFMVVCIHQAARGENVKSVIGYIGESVILKSDADPLWTLETIQWSIYNNVTYIATFDNNETRVNRWPSFEDRLVLNTTSGDLTIKNVMAKDKIKYKVHLQRQGSEEKKISFVQLDVREQFPEPEITVLHSILDDEKCIVSLKCSSLSSDLSLVWKAEHDFSESFWSDCPNVTRVSVMWTSFSNRDVTFSCSATDHNLHKLSQLSVKCPEPKCPSPTFCIICYIFLAICSIVILWKCKDQLLTIRDMVVNLVGQKRR